MTEDGDYIIDEAISPHSRQIALSLCEGEYKVINWLDDEPSSEQIKAFLEAYHLVKYDPFSYIVIWLNHQTNGHFPKITDKLQNCWERDGCFFGFMGKPVYLEYEMAYMPLMLKRYLQARDSSQKIAIITNREGAT
jgi:hypothetical protein